MDLEVNLNFEWCICVDIEEEIKALQLDSSGISTSIFSTVNTYFLFWISFPIFKSFFGSLLLAEDIVTGNANGEEDAKPNDVVKPDEKDEGG